MAPITAQLDLSIWRNDEVCEFKLLVRGVDLTNVELRGQVRMAPDTPGAALVDLYTVQNGNAEGIRLAGVTTTDGVPTSDVRIRINKSTRAALPYSGELGDPTKLVWVLAWGGVTRVVGDFYVLAHALASDSAPTNRPLGAGYGTRVAMPFASATLTIAEDQGATINIEGIDTIAPLLAASKAAVDQAIAAMANARPTTLANATRGRIIFANGSSYFNGAAGQSGAIKIGLPTGIDAREVTARVLVRDHYGSLIFHLAGRNDGAWNYPTARVEGQHQILAEHPVRFGNDGTRDCIWIGNVGYSYWDSLTVEVLEATFTGGPVTEAWMAEWSVGLTTTIENVYVGPIATYLPITSQHVKIDTGRVALSIGMGSGSGTAPSNYNHIISHFGGGLLTSGFNLTGLGLQVFADATIAEACTAMGTQALQHVVDGRHHCAYGIHALLSQKGGIGMVAMGAGAMEYSVDASESTAVGEYSGRDNQHSRCDFFGQRAGLYGATADDQMWLGSIPDANGNANADALIRGDKAALTVQINGALSSRGLNPANDNAFSLGTASLRFSAIFVASGQISTSDERQKTDIGDIPDAWLDAWGEAVWCRYKFVGGSRWHLGLVAQRVHAAFAGHGIDAFEIGLLCYDQWTEETAPIMRKRKVKVKRSRPRRQADGSVRLIVTGKDADGRPIIGPETESYTDTIERMVPTGKTKVVRKAGDMWGLRYDECFGLEAAFQRRELFRERLRNDRLEERLRIIEARLAT
ncbi:tail fiber domain-containing protein [Sphingomonas melonis]|uniref:tail fiber domain-containing protein n=1 Tax=Sphingomonas melonis TaxID=152682 RepID=UPI000368FBD9|nr:tail fiber domain-containing protein [Sphingomonas melonis]